MSSIIDTESAVVVKTSTAEELTNEILRYIPLSWNSVEARQRGGILYTILFMMGTILALMKNLIVSAKIQLRILTATGYNLDLISLDYFGGTPPITLPRQLSETDESFRTRIIAELLRERGTVSGIIKALTALTGAAPIIYEPFNLQVVAAWFDNFNGMFSQGYPSFAFGSNSINQFNGPFSGSNPNTGVGAMGDLNSPYTFYVSVVNNPKSASTKAIVDLVNRIKPAGTVAVVNVR